MPYDGFTAHPFKHKKKSRRGRQEMRHPNARTRLEENMKKYAVAKTGRDADVAEGVATVRKLLKSGGRGEFGIYLIRFLSLPCGKSFRSVAKAIAATVPTLSIRITVPAGYGTPLEEKLPGWRLAGYLTYAARELSAGRKSALSGILDVPKLIVEAIDGLQRVQNAFPVPRRQRIA